MKAPLLLILLALLSTFSLHAGPQEATPELAEESIHRGEEVAPRIVATYNSFGIYWKPHGGSSARTVSVHYRQDGDEEWREALPLWFDAMEHPGEMAKHSQEYRGSIVLLKPGTQYEVKLSLEDGPERFLTAHTRSDNFPIARKVNLPANPSETYTITEGGSPEAGYVLYEAQPGTTWDAKETILDQIKVEASFVIIRGLTLRGAIRHGIHLGDVTDVVIEHCGISGWGRTNEAGQAEIYDCAIFGRGPVLQRITIQHNDLHHPRSDSNSWNEKQADNNSYHPEGAEAITFFEGRGEHVIRFNRIYSDIEHMFYDGIGGRKNFSYSGFPVNDSDIHDNFVSHCWDDALEIEGADMNVRVWNNYMDMTYGAIGAATPSLGPLYLFRNVYAVSRKSEGTKPNDFRGHYLVKLGNQNLDWTHGRMYIFHNTTLQPPPFPEFSKDLSSGAQAGIVFTSKNKTQRNIVSRNNLIDLRKPSDWAIRDTQLTPSNDYDYDMHDGRTLYAEGNGAHNIIASPTYQRTPTGLLELVPGTPGHDSGLRIPNFNDDFQGKAPDRGAIETNDSRKPPTWPDFPASLGETEPTPPR